MAATKTLTDALAVDATVSATQVNLGVTASCAGGWSTSVQSALRARSTYTA